MPSIKADRWIKKMALEHGMIEPFEDRQVRDGVMSYGLSSYGYDIRVADEFKIFTNINSTVVDPKNFDARIFVDLQADICIIPPNSFALAKTVEYFRIPRDVLTVCVGKSTYARCGLIVNVTPFEPEWEGFVTLEISNTTPLPARSTPTRASPRCCSSRATSRARCRTPTRRASIRSSRDSRCRGYNSRRCCAPSGPLFPSIDPSAYVDHSAQIIGDVHVGPESSVWMNVVIRGDVNRIRIGARTNIQDLTLVHVMRDTHPTTHRRQRDYGSLGGHPWVHDRGSLSDWDGSDSAERLPDRYRVDRCRRCPGARRHGGPAGIDGDGHAGESETSAHRRRRCVDQVVRGQLRPVPVGICQWRA